MAPDLGAVKLAEKYASILRRPVAIVRKVRVSGDTVRAGESIGEVRDRTPVIIDDMITTGGTIEAAVRTLLRSGCRREIYVSATHGVSSSPPQRHSEACRSRSFS